ncbi:MAG: hypothetical protein JWL70_768 [Acidimicrobiia bacterium]|nr:hypothetical protein [Acidimicrobiia bacterium]
MRVALRLSVFAGGLAVALGLGAVVGATVGPASAGASHVPPVPQGEGVVAAVGGYRFVPVTSMLPAAGGPFRFVIDGPNGQAVRRFTPTHERDLHLVVVSRDLSTYYHLHPVLAPDGTWAVDLPSLAPGSYRAVADFFVTDGPALALGVDLSVPGLYQPRPLGEPTDRVVVDGLEVRLVTQVRAGGEVAVALSVWKDGREFTDLQPYLGAFGHLVAFRAGDLAYAHVHPVDRRGATVQFEAVLPSEGRYGLYFDFKSGDAVHTAAFTFDQGPVHGTVAPESGGHSHG